MTSAESIAALVAACAPIPDRMVIGDEPVLSLGGGTMDIVDPATSAVLARVPAGNADDVDRAVQSSKAAFAEWRRVAPAERGRVLRKVAALLSERLERFAALETLHTGKPINEARADVHGAIAAFTYYAGAADKIQGDSIPVAFDAVTFTLREPLGVTGHIVPWNFPLGTAVRGIGPAIAAGNTVVLKPADQTPLTALLLADLVRDAGCLPGVLNVVTGTGAGAGSALARHPDIAHVTFTGSVRAGKSVMHDAADHLATVTLELGGKSPVVVLADADVDRAVAGVIKGLYKNSGQICSAGSRLVIDRAIHDAVVEGVVARTRELTIDHGLRDPHIGPLISSAQCDRVDGFVSRARKAGAAVLTGGAVAEVPGLENGFFYAPTILDGVGSDDEVAQEEVFGPVLCVQTTDDADEAFAVANNSRYGLCAGIFTRDIGKAMRIARDIDVGQVYINDYFIGGIETPFGGVKESGFGRERGLAGLDNYTRTKSVAIRIT